MKTHTQAWVESTARWRPASLMALLFCTNALGARSFAIRRCRRRQGRLMYTECMNLTQARTKPPTHPGTHTHTTTHTNTHTHAYWCNALAACPRLDRARRARYAKHAPNVLRACVRPRARVCVTNNNARRNGWRFCWVCGYCRVFFLYVCV